jgi:hypothetical protein
VLQMMRMINISFIHTVENSSHQLQEIHNFVQALIRPSHIISQKLSLRDLELPQNKAEFLASRLQQWVGELYLDTRREVSLNKNH